jgi:DNA-directed RNA polymerase beta subunit
MREWALDINGVDSVFKKASDNLIDAHRGNYQLTPRLARYSSCRVNENERIIESSATSSEFCLQLAEMAQREKDVRARVAIQLYDSYHTIPYPSSSASLNYSYHNNNNNRLADEIAKADHHRLELAGGLLAQTTSMARFGQQLKATQEVITLRNKAFKAYSNRAANYTRKRKSGKAKEKELVCLLLLPLLPYARLRPFDCLIVLSHVPPER